VTTGGFGVEAVLVTGGRTETGAVDGGGDRGVFPAGALVAEGFALDAGAAVGGGYREFVHIRNPSRTANDNANARISRLSSIVFFLVFGPLLPSVRSPDRLRVRDQSPLRQKADTVRLF
jgi:hypothetical protein